MTIAQGNEFMGDGNSSDIRDLQGRITSLESIIKNMDKRISSLELAERMAVMNRTAR